MDLVFKKLNTDFNFSTLIYIKNVYCVITKVFHFLLTLIANFSFHAF